MDDTIIAPASATPGGGPLRRGRDVKGVLARGKTGSGRAVGLDAGGVAVVVDRGEEEKELRAVDVACVVEALGEGFRGLVRGLVKRGGGDSGVPDV